VDKISNAEELARELVVIEEGSATAKGTLGSVLVDLGKAQEGKELLQEVLTCSESRLDMVFTCVFLALAERALGNEGAALTHAKNARLINPKDPILQRLWAENPV
jgi:ABC-type molybdate transport system ATPase subunit